MPRSRVPMPARVRLAFALLVLLAGFHLYGMAALEERFLVGPALLPLVFLVLVARGHPLARQWIRYVAFLCSLGALGFGLRVVVEPSRSEALWFLICTGAGIALFWSVSGREARRFFDVYCGYCSTGKVRARSFFYNRLGCLRCGQEWKAHGPRIDAAVFD